MISKKGSSGKRFLLVSAFISLIISIVFILTGTYSISGIFTVLFFVLLAFFAKDHPVLAAASFTFWMLSFVSAAMFYPSVFSSWNGFQLKVLVIPLIQFIMFGMGTTLSIDDFKRVIKMPHTVIIGMFLQFSIMPFVAKGVAMLLAPNAEIAAGIVLVGTSPGGVASNVITYLAQGNVALSVTMTAFSTLVAPIMCPLMTKLLAGAYIQVSFMEMMISIIKMVIIPICTGIIVNKVLIKLSEFNSNLKNVSDFILKSLPGFAMFAIAFACAILIANAHEHLMMGSVVFSIIAAVIIHNFSGLFLGYWGARAFRLGERECRTIAIEVGMQNSGMAAGLAMSVFKSNLAAAPGVIYSSWHNISGAILASWWRNKKIVDKNEAEK